MLSRVYMIWLLSHPLFPLPSVLSTSDWERETLDDGKGGEEVGEEPNHTTARKPDPPKTIQNNLWGRGCWDAFVRLFLEFRITIAHHTIGNPRVSAKTRHSLKWEGIYSILIGTNCPEYICMVRQLNSSMLKTTMKVVGDENTLSRISCAGDCNFATHHSSSPSPSSSESVTYSMTNSSSSLSSSIVCGKQRRPKNIVSVNKKHY